MITIKTNDLALNFENAKIENDKSSEHGRESVRDIYGNLTIFGIKSKTRKVSVTFNAISTIEKEQLEYMWFDKKIITIIKSNGEEETGFMIPIEEFPLDIGYDIEDNEIYNGTIVFER